MARRSSDCQDKDDIYAVIASLKRREIDTLMKVFNSLEKTRFRVKGDGGEEMLVNAISLDLFAEMESIYKKLRRVESGRPLGDK